MDTQRAYYDYDFIILVKNNDEEASPESYNRYGLSLFTHILKMLKNIAKGQVLSNFFLKFISLTYLLELELTEATDFKNEGRRIIVR